MRGAYGGAQMQDRYKKPVGLPVNRLDMPYYLRDAQPTLSERAPEPDATEARRIKAVANLLALARAELAKASDPNPLFAAMPSELLPSELAELADFLAAEENVMPSELRNFLIMAGLRILTSENPIAELQRFLGRTPKGRGRPKADNAYRDSMIAADVQTLVDGGFGIEAACEAVSKAVSMLDFDAVRKIYFASRDTLETRVELGWRRLRNANPSDPIV
jgi:hypothetical protein